MDIARRRMLQLAGLGAMGASRRPRPHTYAQAGTATGVGMPRLAMTSHFNASQVVAAAGLAAGTGSARGATATIPLTVLPAQPAAVVYGTETGLSSYAHPGAMVIASRGNYADQVFKDISAAGGTVLIYLDVMVINTTGTYHALLFNSSAYGSAVPQWGSYSANGTGVLADFRVGGILQGKLQAIMEKMVTDNPHIGGFFMDDVGSRSWFPNINWSTVPAQDKTDYRAGAIAVCQTARTVCDSHGLMFMVNGTWTANDGGGYPTTSSHGCSLADGGCVEHHDTEISFWGPYASSAQWATASTVTNGTACMFAIMSTSAGVTEFVNNGNYAWVCQQTDYSAAPPSPWGSFHATGLPSHAT